MNFKSNPFSARWGLRRTNKDGFTPLEATPPSRGACFRWGSLTGFTLLEILVAMAIIVTIVSIVYGSYFATSKSTQVCKARMTLYQQGQNVLEQMARQIRCSYSGTGEKHTYSVTSISQPEKKIPENEVNYYFEGNSDEPTGEILHLVTTNGILGEQKLADGLFEVIYKFDKSTGVLFFSQARFIGAPKNIMEKRNWRPIARNIKCIELSFFDGQQWLNKWIFRDRMKLPSAVKIEISCENENYQQCHCSTVAYVCCQMNQSKGTQSETLVSVNKRWD